MNTTNKERYIFCRDAMEDERTYTWEDWSEVVKIPVPGCEDKLEKMAWVNRRNSIKKEINRRAQASGAEWRLQIVKQGESLHKAIGTTAVREDVPLRCKRIAQHMQGAKTEWEALSHVVELLEDDSNLLKSLMGLISGTITMIRGAVREMKQIPDEVKERIINLFDDEEKTKEKEAV